MKYSKWILGLIAALTFTSAASAAAYYTLNGRGFAVGGCSGGYGWRSCINNIEWRAENDAKYDADRQCNYMKGRLQSPFPTSCWHRCNPMFEPPQNQYAHVTCNSDCSFTCVVQ